ncbi:BglG family transcription antiterminator [Enterococcus saccharolyticus]|uniref:BglG family transcription antiterminator n=1 Tax=Enterococcus TaxID=1350 RepID=UPI001E519695|nr:BglG family transcription antiterminator [Enterococcus saccharolyticus]MCD5003298.1 BglG family transcription antiterminator [Enterococcus saccharolyticus]
MLSQKEITILKTLYNNLHTYVNSQEIASELKVSDRTARKYLSTLREKLSHNQAEIEAKQGQGYRLKILDEQRFETFYRHELQLVPTKNEITSIHEAKDRQYFILNSLFFSKGKLFMDDLASELFVSRSTISNDIVEVRKLLKPYDIEIKSKAGKGIYLSGSEQNNRHFIMNYFFMNRLQDNLYTFSNYVDFLEGISIEEIVIIVLDECRESQLGLSDFIIYNLVLHIGLAVKRIQAGFEIQVVPTHEFPQEAKEYQTALKIIRRLEETLHIAFPEEEATYIAMHLRNKVTSKKIFEKSTYTETQVKNQLIAALAKIDQQTGFALQQDTILIDGLLIHLTPLLTRLQNQTSIENPLLEDIKQKYGHLLALTIDNLSTMPVFQEYTITESEWAYITIHVTAAVERFFNSQKARVMVICATGLGSSQMLRIRLEHELGSKIIIEQVSSYYEISEELLEGIDLIISSIHLPNVIYSIPIVHVSVFLDDQDIQAINHELSKLKNNQNNIPLELREDGNEEQQTEKLIRQVMKPELFFRLSEQSEKEAVLNVLINKMNELESHDISSTLAKQLKLRESYSTVAFSPYLAVPHPIEPVTERAYVSIVVAPEGIYWDEEHPNIQLVFLMSPDYKNQTELEKISHWLVPIIENDTLRKKLVHCQNYDEFLSVFIEHHEKN